MDEICLVLPTQECRLSNEFPPFHYFPHFFSIRESIGYLLNITIMFDECHPQLSCGDTCPIDLQNLTYYTCIGNIKNEQINEENFSFPNHGPLYCNLNMRTSFQLSATLALYEGNLPVTGGFPHKGPVAQALMFYLRVAWTNGRTNRSVQVIWDAMLAIVTSL